MLTGNTNPVLLAVRLGWLVVETFGRLRRYACSGYKRQQDTHGDANRRFSFSDRFMSERVEYFFAVDQLRHTIAKLKSDLPPCPLFAPEHVQEFLAAKVDLDACQYQLDDCSLKV